MKLSKTIDHTLLKPDATEAEIIQLCNEAKEYDFASVCVNPCRIETAVSILKDTDVKVCCVIGFPLGAMRKEAKVFEAQDAVTAGADEVDMVLNIGKLKEGKDDYVIEEIHAVKEAVGDRVLKVILETCLLSEEEIVRACQDAKAAGADFVKTSTGFSKGGATAHDVALMRKTVGEDMSVKASGGIRTAQDFHAMLEAGATRIGTSSGVRLVSE
ncbi:MAG: deoxyribose-phosphate aldolase [Solobacterium sp.]|nr:deoxyribose-phosphate aldolase [Solobacterium sp.]